MKAKLLLVEDDALLARGLLFNLEKEGYSIVHAADGASAQRELARKGWGLILLDLSLPDADGIDLLRGLRLRDQKTPVICLTSRAQETDIVMGLTSGADDYVTKPFGLAELLARIAVRLRGSSGAAETALLFGPVRVDLAAHKVLRPEGTEELTPLELQLLQYLWARRGQAVERSQILRELWGVDHLASTRTLDNHMARLRRKLELDPKNPRFLTTVHGTGYRLEAPGTTS